VNANGSLGGFARSFELGRFELLPFVAGGSLLAVADAGVLAAALERFTTLSVALNTPDANQRAAHVLPQLAALLAVHAAVGLGLGVVTTYANQRVTGRVRASLFARIRLAFPTTTRDDDVARLGATLAHEVNRIVPLVDAVVVGLVRHTLALAALGFVALRHGQRSVVPILFAFALVGVVTLIVSRATRTRSRRMLEAAARHSSRILERLRLRDVDWVHRRGIDAKARAEATPTLDELAESELSLRLVSGASRPAVEAVLAGTLMTVWYATTSLGAAEASAAAALVLAIRPITSLFAAVQSLPMATAAAERLLSAANELAPVPRGATDVGDAPALVINSLLIGYDGHALVSELNGTIACGEVLLVVGPNGSGKSTLLSTVVGARLPLAGSVEFGGADPRDAVSSNGRSAIGYAPASVQLERGQLDAATGAMDRAELERALECAGFHDFRATAPELDSLGADGIGASTGQRAKLAIARALLGAPALLVLDEPTASLDLASARSLVTHLRAYARRGAVVVVASHDTAIVAIADVVLDLGDDAPAFRSTRAARKERIPA
jgi:ABC-type multidrug transport system fused ATPase/permease subunit